MRKITEEAMEAFQSDTGKYNKQNTRITFDGETHAMYLHGNCIAIRRGQQVWISNAGWSSNTTKERLNGLSNARINQRDFAWYLNGLEWDGSWVRLPIVSGQQWIYNNPFER